jgi:predicted helicase
MVASVEHVLKNEFQKSLGDKDVQILDPFTGNLLQMRDVEIAPMLLKVTNLVSTPSIAL